MSLRDIFSRKKSVSLFYSEQEAQARWKKQIREKIRIPANVQAFTSGGLRVPVDDGAEDAAARYDARRIPGTNRWDIEKTTRFPKGTENTALAGLAGQNGIKKIGEAPCDFDALRYISEAAAGQESALEEDMPHWKSLAAQALQPIDTRGIVWPVDEGKILGDPGGTILFSDDQLAILKAARTPAAVAATARTAPVKRTLSLVQKFSRMRNGASMDRSLYMAARSGQNLLVKDLLAFGADPNTRVFTGVPLLQTATSHGHVLVVEELIRAKAGLDAQDDLGRTALHIAVYEREAQIVQILLKAGANPNISDKGGVLPIIAAARGRYTEIVQLFLGADSDVMTPVYLANVLLSDLLRAASEKKKREPPPPPPPPPLRRAGC